MRYRDGRRSVCVSSQSGCPLTCTFCATGQMKFGRNLTASEILDQVLHFRRIEPLNHLVFMGMGEPMMNLDNVLGAARKLPDLGITHRRTGISTVGWEPGIRKLTESDMPIRLALSLHAPEDALRSKIMPVNERYSIAEVLAACEAYYERRRRKVFVEYVMLAGVNDSLRPGGPAHAAARPADLQAQPDPVQPDRLGLRRLLARRDRRVPAALEEHGLRATVRLTRGRDIDAACGQLAAKGLVWLAPVRSSPARSRRSRSAAWSSGDGSHCSSSGSSSSVAQAEQLQEQRRRAVEHGAERRAPRLLDQAALGQRRGGGLRGDAADAGHLRPRDRLQVGDDRQRLGLGRA